jgi:hypothetical protein
MQDFYHRWHCQAYEMVKPVFHVSSAVGNYIVLVVCVILLVTKVHLLLGYPKFYHIHHCHHGALIAHVILWRFGLILYGMCHYSIFWCTLYSVASV